MQYASLAQGDGRPCHHHRHHHRCQHHYHHHCHHHSRRHGLYANREIQQLLKFLRILSNSRGWHRGSIYQIHGFSVCHVTQIGKHCSIHRRFRQGRPVRALGDA